MTMNWQPTPKNWNADVGAEYAANTGEGWHAEIEPVGKRWRWRLVMLGTLPVVGEADAIDAAKATVAKAVAQCQGGRLRSA
jgi:hypothetical protein